MVEVNTTWSIPLTMPSRFRTITFLETKSEIQLTKIQPQQSELEFHDSNVESRFSLSDGKEEVALMREALKSRRACF